MAAGACVTGVSLILPPVTRKVRPARSVIAAIPAGPGAGSPLMTILLRCPWVGLLAVRPGPLGAGVAAALPAS
jgi:hypothetical protein